MVAMIRSRTTVSEKPDTGYIEVSKRQRASGSHPTVDQRLARLERLSDAHSDSDEGKDTKDPPKDAAALSVAMTRQNLRLRIGIGLLGTILTGIAAVATSVWSYAQGLAEDIEKLEDRIESLERAREREER
jgi:hypothetical protein